MLHPLIYQIILISPLNFGFMTIEHQDKEIYLLITATQVALHFMNHFRTDGNGLHAAKFPTSLISNQWVRFVYVKNTKIYINNTVTNIQQVHMVS